MRGAVAPSLSEVLEDARRRTGLQQTRLAELFREAGGKGTNGTVEEWLRGSREPKVSQCIILARVLNEQLRRLGEPDSILVEWVAQATNSDEKLRERDSNAQPTGLHQFIPIPEVVPSYLEDSSSSAVVPIPIEAA